jgi:hypothetical protein
MKLIKLLWAARNATEPVRDVQATLYPRPRVGIDVTPQKPRERNG